MQQVGIWHHRVKPKVSYDAGKIKFVFFIKAALPLQLLNVCHFLIQKIQPMAGA